MKNDTVFKKTFNRALDHIAAIDKPGRLESETRTAAKFDVSRTTIRKVLFELQRR